MPTNNKIEELEKEIELLTIENEKIKLRLDIMESKVRQLTEDRLPQE